MTALGMLKRATYRLDDLVNRMADGEPKAAIICFALFGAVLLSPLAITTLLRNPIITQTPLTEPVTVDVKRSCSSAIGPCTSCSPGMDGEMNCATMTSGNCPGTRLMREVQQEMMVTRKRGDPKSETVVIESEALSSCS